jgi:hypothetical protein
MMPSETNEATEAQSAQSIPGKIAKVAFVLLLIAAMAFAGIGLLVIEDQCVLAGHNWSRVYSLMVFSVPAPIIFGVIAMLLLGLTPLTLRQIRPVIVWALVVCAFSYGFILYAGTRTNIWLGGEKEPHGPEFCQILRRT